jgi:hypothetical protein
LTIPLNGLLQVQYIVENANKIENFEAPAFNDFRIMSGPSESSGMSIVNNKVTQYKALLYILKPLHKGRLVVPGATAMVDGKKMQSNKVIIEVGNPTASPQNVSPFPGIPSYREVPEEDFILEENESAEEKIKQNLFVKLELDKTTAYIGEPIVATYKLYTRLRSESRVTKRPSMNGFSVYDMIEPDGAGPYPEKLNGKSYMVHIIRKTQLFPLQEGSFELEPVELDNSIRFLRRGNDDDVTQGQSPLDKMFDDLLPEASGKWEDHRVTLSSQSQIVTIKPLPEGAPASFNGAVGKFILKGNLKDSTVSAGDNAVYELTIEGSGNLPLVNAPQWQLADTFEQFDPAVSEDINKMVSPMQGTKKIIYTFTPSVAGNYQLPSIEFSYFDPSTSQYKILETGKPVLYVTPSDKRSRPVPLSGNSPGNEKNNMNRIWISGLAIFLAAWLVVLIRNRKSKQKPIEIPPVKTIEPVPDIPPDPLEKVKTAANLQHATAYYRALELALWKVIAEKLQIPGSAQQKPQALQMLLKRGMPSEDIRLLEQCLNECEWALYVPAGESNIDYTLLEKAGQLINTINGLK